MLAFGSDQFLATLTSLCAVEQLLETIEIANLLWIAVALRAIVIILSETRLVQRLPNPANFPSKNKSAQVNTFGGPRNAMSAPTYVTDMKLTMC